MQSIVSPMDVATSNTGGIPAEGHPPLAAHRPPAASMGPPSAPASASVLPATTSRTGVSQSGAGDKKSRGKNFSLDESTQLARSWINVSEDPKVGAYQTGATFWTRVFQHYHQNRLSHWPERTASSLENKFKTMSAEVSKFVAAFKQIEDHVASGWGPEDIFQEAIKLFEEVNKSVFSWKALSPGRRFLCVPSLTRPTLKRTAREESGPLQLPSRKRLLLLLHLLLQAVLVVSVRQQTQCLPKKVDRLEPRKRKWKGNKLEQTPISRKWVTLKAE